jgi:hypothetical protein
MLRYTTRSVRRASGLVLVGNSYLTGIREGLPVIQQVSPPIVLSRFTIPHRLTVLVVYIGPS